MDTPEEPEVLDRRAQKIKALRRKQGSLKSKRENRIKVTSQANKERNQNKKIAAARKAPKHVRPSQESKVETKLKIAHEERSTDTVVFPLVPREVSYQILQMLRMKVLQMGAKSMINV